MIGKLQRVPLREVWKHEALDFTRWLEENIDVLSDCIGIPLSNAERERTAGAFSVDLVAEDASGAPVIIENQLERSDHDHLGKLITYMRAVGARTAVWIVAEARPEHLNAIAWLNESPAASFYLLQVEAVRIGDSPPATLLTLLVGPSAEAREVGEVKKELAERHTLRIAFWTSLLKAARSKTKLHAAISPSRDSWIAAGAGLSGVSFNYTVLRHHSGVELYIGRDVEQENTCIFEALLAHKVDIEGTFGGPLEWHALEGKKACRIYHRIEPGGYAVQEHWHGVQAAMIDAMVRLESALRPHLREAFRVAVGER